MAATGYYLQQYYSDLRHLGGQQALFFFFCHPQGLLSHLYHLKSPPRHQEHSFPASQCQQRYQSKEEIYYKEVGANRSSSCLRLVTKELRPRRQPSFFFFLILSSFFLFHQAPQSEFLWLVRKKEAETR